MTNNQIKKLIEEHFKPRSHFERVWCTQTVLPFAKKLLDNQKNHE